MKKKEQPNDNRVQELRRGYLNEPTVIYRVGESVIFGNHPNAEIIRVLDGGKILEIKVWGEYQVYGQPVYKEDTHIVMWTDLEPYRTVEENATIEILTQPDDLRLQFSQRGMGDIFSKYYYFGIDMSPEYQRGNVWGEQDKEKLLDSIFDNIDIGKFAFIRRSYSSDKELYEILDGKQRITAIIGYYENRYRYCGKLYRELHWRDQNHFKHYNVNIAETNIDQVDKAKVLKYFLKLNVTGHQQDPNHIAYVEGLLRRLT
jgi:hypothetical protein